MKTVKTIGFTFNTKDEWALGTQDPKDLNAEFDSMATVNFITTAIEARGYKVKPIGNVDNLLKEINDLGVDIVFNIAEGFAGRNRESQVPVILEMKNIPFIGSDALTLGITLDKIVAKKCFLADGIPTPKFFEARGIDDLRKLNTIGFPLIVKCRSEGTSKGLSKNSRVEDYKGLKRQVDLITQTYNQTALVEEFVRGTEFTVAVLGNENPVALPVVQIQIDGKTNLGDEFYTFERVVTPGVRYLCPAQIPKEISRTIQDIAVRAYRSVECRDFGRVDFRVDDQGRPYVLEINPLPNLGHEDVFNIIPQTMGRTYEDVIHEILGYGFARYGFKPLADRRPTNELTGIGSKRS